MTPGTYFLLEHNGKHGIAQMQSQGSLEAMEVALARLKRGGFTTHGTRMELSNAKPGSSKPSETTGMSESTGTSQSQRLTSAGTSTRPDSGSTPTKSSRYA